MEVDYAENVPASRTPQRSLFDPTQPSTSRMSVNTTPRANSTTPLVIKYDEHSTPTNKHFDGFQRNTEQQFEQMNPYPSTPSRSTSRMSVGNNSPFRAQNSAANERVQQLREAAIGKQNYMQQWMGSGYSLPSPQRQQRPPSMIGSTISHMSDMSRFSIGGMSTLSVNTEIANYAWPQNPHQAPHILSKVSGSSAENQDPMRMSGRMNIHDILQFLKSNEPKRQMMSLCELLPMAEQNQLEMMIEMKTLKALIYALFEILLPKEKEDEKVVEMTLYILYHAVLHPSKKRTCLKIYEALNLEIMNGRGSSQQNQTPQGLYSNDVGYFDHHHPLGIFRIILYRASQWEARYITKAWVLLSHLSCNTLFKRRIFAAKTARPEFQHVRREIIGFAVESLKKDLKPKPKGFAVSMIRNLSASNDEIMGAAMHLDAVSIFLNIMKEETIHEDLMWSTAQALFSFCVVPINGEHFIRLGGAQVICDLLSHGSSRLLHELLGVMARIADLPAIKEQNMAQPIEQVVQLLGSFDPTIVERSTAILTNIGAHNKSNKAILLRCGVPNHVFAVLRMSDQYLQLAANPNQVEVIRTQIASIYENCLLVLNNVSLMSAQDNREIAVEACKMISCNTDSAATFLNFICIGKRNCRRLAITVLKRVIETVPSYAERFVDLYATTRDQLPMLLLKRVWESMKQWVMLPDGDEYEKKKKEHEDIVRRSSGLLTTLCTESNPRFFKDVKKAMLSEGANPFLLLSHDLRDPILYDWLSFIYKICITPDAQQNKLLLTLMSNANMIQSSFMRELHDRRVDPNIRTIIVNLMQTAEQQHINS